MYFFVLEAGDAAVCMSRCWPRRPLAAALYPMQIVARLPIAATLRNEVLS